MKLRNKKTGEIGWLYCDHISVPKKMTVFAEDKDLSANHWDYKSLAELNEDWEDYEEPKEYWYIGIDGEIYKKEQEYFNEAQDNIGNRFETREEVEKAVEKLKAWKRLKDARFEFGTIKYNLDEESSSTIAYDGIITIKGMAYEDFTDDLDLLFCSEENI